MRKNIIRAQIPLYTNFHDNRLNGICAAAPSRVGGLLKKGWNEIPGVMGSSVLGIFGLLLGTASVMNYLKNGKFERKYKQEYTVYRPDDPRVEKLKNIRSDLW